VAIPPSCSSDATEPIEATPHPFRVRWAEPLVGARAGAHAAAHLAVEALAASPARSVDTASEVELTETLAHGGDPRTLVCTAAVKAVPLLRTCLAEGVTIVLDNDDELDLVEHPAAATGCTAIVSLRFGGFRHDGRVLPTRFGFDLDDAGILLTRLRAPADAGRVRVEGVHCHLDGDDVGHRVAAVTQVLAGGGRLARQTPSGPPPRRRRRVTDALRRRRERVDAFPGRASARTARGARPHHLEQRRLRGSTSTTVSSMALSGAIRCTRTRSHRPCSTHPYPGEPAGSPRSSVTGRWPARDEASFASRHCRARHGSGGGDPDTARQPIRAHRREPII
jgi:hypothetical protein